MVEHERPDDEKRPLNTYICHPSQKKMAEKCIKLLSSFPHLKVWETQYPTMKDYTCFYVSYKHTETPWILNFTIYPHYTNVEFRYPQYLPDKFLDGLRWITRNWAYARFSSVNEDRIRKMLSAYTASVREPFDNGKLKQGGKSFAEDLIADLIREAFPALSIKGFGIKVTFHSDCS